MHKATIQQKSVHLLLQEPLLQLPRHPLLNLRRPLLLTPAVTTMQHVRLNLPLCFLHHLAQLPALHPQQQHSQHRHKPQQQVRMPPMPQVPGHRVVLLLLAQALPQMWALVQQPSLEVGTRLLGALSSKLVLLGLKIPLAVQALQVVQAIQAAMVLLGMVLQGLLAAQYLVLAPQVQVQHPLQVALRVVQRMQGNPRAQAQTQAVRAQAAC